MFGSCDLQPNSCHAYSMYSLLNLPTIYYMYIVYQQKKYHLNEEPCLSQKLDFLDD